MGVMSPDAGKHEVNGMKVGQMYAAKRPNLSAADLRKVADLLWQHYALNLGRADFANGLREGMYIASQMRMVPMPNKWTPEARRELDRRCREGWELTNV